jgi:hypothetical protein
MRSSCEGGLDATNLKNINKNNILQSHNESMLTVNITDASLDFALTLYDLSMCACLLVSFVCEITRFREQIAVWTNGEIVRESASRATESGLSISNGSDRDVFGLKLALRAFEKEKLLIEHTQSDVAHWRVPLSSKRTLLR